MFQSRSSYSWTLGMGTHVVNVPATLFDKGVPYLRLRPSEIFGLLGQPTTNTTSRVVAVTARNGSAAISTNVTFKGQASGGYSHANPASFKPVFTGGNITFAYDLRGLRNADGGVLIVTDIDRAVPQAFPDNDVNGHGFKRTLNGLVGTIALSAADFPHGVGTYGIAIRGTHGGTEIADSTSFFLPLRYAPAKYQLPATPKIQAAASVLNGTAPLFYEAADTEPGGSTQFAVTYDVSSVSGAKNALIEFSAPTLDFAKGVFFTGNFTASNSLVNNFTNPNGDRLDSGDLFGQPGEAAHVPVAGKKGAAVLDGTTVGLSIPTGHCDSTYQVRVFGTDAAGHILGIAGNGSILSYGDFSRAACKT